MATGFHFMSSGNGQGTFDQDRLDVEAVPDPSESLSYDHICTEPSLQSSSWRDDREAGSSEVVFWRGGSLVEVRDVKPDQDAHDRVVGLRGLRETSKRRHLKDHDGDQVGAKRGKVGGFSYRSRRRMHLLTGRIDASAPCLLVTLTIADVGPDGALVPCDGRSMKQYLKRFKVKLTRKFGQAAALWRLEPVPRQSGVRKGEGVAHYHLILWNVLDQPGLRQWVGQAWSECVGVKSRTSVEVPRSNKRVQGYLAKLYISKPGDEVLIEDVGRYWGVLQDHLIPWGVVLVRRLSYRETVLLLRALRRWVKADRRKRGKVGKIPYLVRWKGFFVGEASYWAERVGRIVGVDDDPAALLSGIGRAVEVKTL